jgi:hypothetical protein
MHVAAHRTAVALGAHVAERKFDWVDAATLPTSSCRHASNDAAKRSAWRWRGGSTALFSGLAVGQDAFHRQA